MKINNDAVHSLIRTAVGANNAAKRELKHALEYYNAAPSHHSMTRLMLAAAALVSQNEVWNSASGEKARDAFCSIIEIAA